MAKRNLEVIVTVRDAASAPLKNVENQLKRTGAAAKGASLDFIQFNKTLFTTTAFVGTFVKAFSTLSNALNQGAELDRLEAQYERVLGSKGVLIKQIKNLTTTSVDEMEAMRQGLKLSNLGLVGNSEQVANIMAKAATAAKLAGIDSAEGMKKISDFMASGSVSNLEFLGLLSRTNPALQAQLAILNKAGGVMGTVISTQQKLAIGMGVLNAAVQGQLKGARDLADVMLDFTKNIDMTRREIGRFLGAALGPLIDRFSNFLLELRTTVSEMRKNEKTLVFLAKAFIIATGAVVGFLGALGALKLAVRLLGFAGLGVPGLTMSLLTLTGAFVGLTDSADSMIERLKLFGAFLQGIHQLMESLDPESGFAKMDKSIHDMLKKHGLLTLVQNIARVGSIIKTVVSDSIQAFKSLASTIDSIFGGTFRKLVGALDSFKEPWSNFWVKDSITPIQKMVRAAAVILGGFFAVLAGKKLFGLLGSVLSKIPIIGKLFGGGGKGGGPAGTSNDPIYVRDADKIFSALSGGMGKGILDKIGGVLGKTTSRIAVWVASRLAGLSMMFDLVSKSVISAASSAFSVISRVAGPLLAAYIAFQVGHAIGGMINGLIDKHTQGKTDEGFEGNIVERGFFKLFGSEQQKKQFRQNEEFGSKSDLDLINEQRSRQGKSPLSELPEHMRKAEGSKTSVAVPQMPDTQLDVVDALGEQMKNLEGDKRLKFQQSVESALASGSASGMQITPDEWTSAMTDALDNSENLSILAQKAQQAPSSMPPASRRK